MSDSVFLAGGAQAAAKKRKKKKMVEVEDDEVQLQPASEPAVESTPAESQPQPQPPRDSTPPPVADDEDEFNPLAEAMAASAAAVAVATANEPTAAVSAEVDQPKVRPVVRAANGTGGAKKKSNLASMLGSSSAANATSELTDAAAALSTYAQPTSSNGTGFTQSSGSAASFSTSNRRRDEFDSELDQALGRSGGVSVTSSGYIDPNDLKTIERLRNTKKEQVDEFEFEEVADVTTQSLAAQPAKSNQFDEFEDVWADTEKALVDPSKAAGGRKVLKASKDQKKVEKPDAKEEARLRKEKEVAEALAAKAEAEKREKEELEQGLQNPLLAKLGIAPTNILAQYDSEKAKPKPVVTAEPAKKKREQDILESNDAVLAAAASSSTVAAPGPTNAVDALVSAHTSSSSSDPNVEHELAAEIDQWSAVNTLREKQEQEAKAEAERIAKAGKQIGVKASDHITRDTPIHYDAALRSLTVAPSCPSSAPAIAPDGSATSPPPSTAAQIALLKQKIQTTDFRDIGMSRKLRYSLFPPKLKSARLEEERDLVFCMAQMKIDYTHCVDHERILCSIYRGLTNDPLTPPTFGNHWQIIGFQDKDPATDLRGAGLFSLIQLLWFMKHHKDLMLKIYTLSQDDRQNFPFCTLSTNITGMVLQALRECVLYGECRRQGSVYTVVHTLYVAAFYEMYLTWKNENCTIVSWNDVKQRLEHLVLHTPKPLMAKFKANQYSMGGEGGPPEPLEFTEIP